MINATHYVLDLETMGTGPNAAIVAIGCVEVHEGQLAREFYQRIELADAIAKGGEVSALTIEWWLKRSEAARAEVNGTQEAESLWNALGALRVFMAGTGLLHDVLVWGNGPSFDNVILASAYRRYGGEAPWAYWNDRDLRTLTALYPAVKNIPFEGTRHHALHDARHEARQLVAALEMHEARAEVAAEHDQLCSEIAALRKDAKHYVPVHEALQRAAGELPNGWEIRLSVERDAGGVELYGPEGTEEQFASDHERLDYTVTDALEAALAAQGGAA